MTAAPVALLHARLPRSDRDLPPTPPWLSDETCLRRALAAKQTHPPSEQFWPLLAGLARLGAAFLDGDVGVGEWLERTAQLLDDLATELPEPSAARYDPRRCDFRWMTRRHRPLALDDLADCITRVALVLTDPHPPCLYGLYGLADLVDDFAVAAATYALTECASPSPHHPSVSTRCGDRGPP